MNIDKTKVAILNYNIGNLASVKNAFLSLGIDAKIVTDAESLTKYDKLILPGVGAFENAMQHLHKSGMKEALFEFAKTGKSIFGICLGMQLLFDKSYEFGEHDGLGFISGEVVKFENSNLKIPHMGWNSINILRDSTLLSGVNDGEYLYFVHSFYVKSSYMDDVVATCDYGVNFSAIVQKDNIFGIQPHPEKSSKIGLKILENFVKL